MKRRPAESLEPSRSRTGRPPAHLTRFRPDDWPAAKSQVQAWQAHRRALIAWCAGQHWTSRQRLGLLHPDWIRQGWADPPAEAGHR